MPNNKQSCIITLAEAANQHTTWTEYAKYCRLREQGLRKQAFQHLNQFLRYASQWSMMDKIEFVAFLHTCLDQENADYDAIPVPLYHQLSIPTLKAWCRTEQHDPRPFCWYAKGCGEGLTEKEKYLYQALDINPQYETARLALIKMWLHETYFSIHHLPEGFIGHPDEAIAFAHKAQQEILNLINTKKKNQLQASLEEDLEIINNYIAWRESGHHDFKIWGMDNHKKVGLHSGDDYR